MKNNNGFTLIEVMVTIILLSSLVAMSLSRVDFTSSMIQSNAAELMASMAEIESSYGNYLNDKNISPTGLTDATFVPIYLMIPNEIKNFDSAYGTSGYVLVKRTGQPVGNNGWYIAARTTCKATDIVWKGIIVAGGRLSANKFFYNSTVAAVTNIAPPAASTLIYITYWITRY